MAVALDWGLIVPVDPERGREVDPRPRARDAGPGRAGAHEAAEARGDPGRHLHGHEPGGLRLALRHADHPAAAGRDPGRRHDREAPGRRHGRERQRRARHPHGRISRALLRPPADRRRRRGPVHGGASRRRSRRGSSIWVRKLSAASCQPSIPACHPFALPSCHPERSEGSVFLAWSIALQRFFVASLLRMTGVLALSL